MSGAGRFSCLRGISRSRAGRTGTFGPNAVSDPSVTIARMELDRNGLEVMSREDCLPGLATVPVARIGLSMNALPVVLPINFVIDGDELVIRTAEGSKLDAALAQAVVAIEADHFDQMGHVGWSVLVRGVSRVLTLPSEVERAKRLSLEPWANDAADRFIAVSSDVVSGRRIHPWYHDGHGSTHAPALRHTSPD